MSELRVLYPKPETGEPQGWVHRVDIVFVHGLNPLSKADHAENTWTHKSGYMWPRDALPSALPDARVMLFSYNSHVAWDVSEAGIREHADSLLDMTQSRRDEVSSDVPLIFVGHSLGGLVIKQALLHATHNHRVYGKLRACTKALVFFGVPHRGGNGAVIGQVLAKSLSLFSGAHRNDLVDNLKKSSKYLAQSSADFAHQSEDYQFLSVIETRGLLRGPIRTVVVESTAAILGLAGHREQVLELDRDHRQICKLEQGPDLNRVLRHVKRVAKAAMESTSESSQRSAMVASNTKLAQSTKDVQIKGTLGFRPRVEFYGPEQSLDDIQAFLNNVNAQTLLVYGPAGVGKSVLVAEAMHRNENDYSIFWFDAQTPDTLQHGFDLASHVIAPELRKVFLLNTRRNLLEWLASDKVGRWILIFDNVTQDFDPLVVIPDGLNNDKIIAVSRNPKAFSTASASVLVSESPASNGWALFLSVWESQSYRQRRGIRDLPKLKQTVEKISHRPLIMVWAANCAMHMPPGSIAENLEDLNDEEGSSAGHLDRTVWKWFNLVVECLSPNDVAVLRLLTLFKHTYISNSFLDLLKGSRRAAAGLGPYAASVRTSFSSSIVKLTQYNLLSQHRDSGGSYFCIEPTVQEHVCYYQQCNPAQTEELLEAGSDLLVASWRMTTEKSSSEQQSVLEVIIPHLRAFCLSLRQYSTMLSSQHADLCLGTTMYLLKKCIEEASERYVTQFWRTWIVSENFHVAEGSMAEDDGSQFIVPSKTPVWMNSDVDSSLRLSRIVEAVSQAIDKSLEKHFTQGVMVAALGQAWHGIRDDIFAYIRQIGRERFTDEELKYICNEVEKGATAGLLSAIQAVLVHDAEFVSEIVHSLGGEIMEEIAYLIVDSTPTSVFDVVADEIDPIIEKALSFLMYSTFHAVSSCFSDIFNGSVAALIRNLLDTAMSADTAMDSYEKSVAFMTDTMGNSAVRERSRRVARGFWQVVDGTKTWLAAKVVHETLTAKQALMHPGEREEMTANLIHLVRHGVMELEARQTPVWRLSARQMMYWTLQAEQARVGWGALDPAVRAALEFEDQERWDESRIYMDMSSGQWPVC